LRPELREDKELEHSRDSKKNGNVLPRRAQIGQDKRAWTHWLAGILLPLTILTACTSLERAGPVNPAAPAVQTGTNCPDGSPWYRCTGYRESSGR
jgi:hypothetical protein